MFTLAVQLYWVSFIIIGLGVSLWFLGLTHPAFRKTQKAIQYILGLHPIVALSTTWCIGIAAFMPFVVFGYVFEIKIAPLLAIYVLLLTFSLAILTNKRSIAKGWLWSGLPQNTADRLLFGGALLVLTGDYAYSLISGGTLAVDAPVHVSRINSILLGSLSLSDPYLGSSGVLDPRYSWNLLAALQAVGAKLLGSTAVDMWLASGAFYRLMIWLSLFVFAWFILPKTNRNRLSTSLLVVLPLCYSAFFNNALFPDRIVFVFMALFFSGMILWIKGKGSFLLILSSCLIALTHALNALFMAGFIALFVVALFVARIKSNVFDYQGMFVSGAVLCMPVLLNLFYPNRTDLSSKAFNAFVISGNAVEFQKYGMFWLHKIHNPVTVSLILSIIAIAVYVFIFVHAKRKALKIILAIGLSIVAYIVYTPLILSIIGYVYLLKVTKEKSLRLLILLMMLFYALIIYNPVLIPLIKDNVPPWVIGRVQEVNLLSLMVATIGVYAIILFIVKQLGLKRNSVVITIAFPVVAFVLITSWPHTFSVKGSVDSLARLKRSNIYYDEHSIREAYVRRAANLREQITDKTVLTSSNDTQFLLPMVSSARVISLLETNYSPMANIPLRDTCHKALVDKLDRNDLVEAKIDYIVADKSDPKDQEFIKKIATKPYITVEKESQSLVLYKVELKDKSLLASSVCSIPYRQ